MSRAVSLTAPTPAAPAGGVDDGEELIGATVAGRYLVQSVIGRGGMGVVLEALHAELGQTYALKVLGRQFARDDAVVRRFIREARTVAQIGHPHIVAVHDLGVLDDGRPYLAMERVRGQTLRERVRHGGAVSPAETAAILAGVAEALEVVHARGIVHRDVKLENIMLAEQHAGPPVAKLLDFGVATMTTPEPGAARITQHGMLLGTPLYLPPEAGESAAVDARWDVYALGVVCYAMMTTRWPFDGDTPLVVLTRKLLHAPPPLSDDERVFDDELERVVAAALATVPSARTSSARALIAGLAAAVERSPHGGVRARDGQALPTDVLRPDDARTEPRGAGATAGLAPAAGASRAHVAAASSEDHEAGAHTLAQAGLHRPRAVRVAAALAAGAAALVVLGAVVLHEAPTPVDVPIPIAAVADPQASGSPGTSAVAPGPSAPAAAAAPASDDRRATGTPPPPPATASPAPEPVRPSPSPPSAVAARPSASAPLASTPAPASPSASTRPAPPAASPGTTPGGLDPSAPARVAEAGAGRAPSGLDEPGGERRVRALPARAELPARPEPRPSTPPGPTPPLADPERAARLTREGLDLLLAGELARAVEVLDAATRADERHVPAWRALATAADRAGRASRAIEAYRRYLLLADDQEDARVVERARRRLAELKAAR